MVNGTVEVTISFDQDPDPHTLTIAFDGELIVVGEYSYSGDIVIDGKVHKTG